MNLRFAWPTPWPLIALIGMLTACGGGDHAAPATPGSASSLANQIWALEKDGQLPILDRSNDIRGPDADQNGIRDDIDAWIAAQPITDRQKQAARQAARVRQQELLVDLKDVAALDHLGDLSMAGVKCLGLVFEPNHQAGSELGRTIEAMTANTRMRAARYLAYNRTVSGSSGSLPSGDTCDPAA